MHLPEPEAELQLHSQRVQQYILQDLQRQGGWIPFSRYMEHCLYAPGLGYYSAGLHKFGSRGDFITAAEIGSLFAETLARVFIERLDRLGGGAILELGGGSGRFAADALQQMERLGALPEAWYMLERSADLRQRQQRLLKREMPQFFSRMHWLDSLPENLPAGVVYGNEVLDALPVEILRRTSNRIVQLGVIDAGGKLALDWQQASPELATNFLQRIPADVDPYTSELCPLLPAWIGELARVFRRGYWLFSDYGYPRQAYYHWQRTQGTLQCHFRHRAHDDVLFWPGLQDLTAHVDFDAVAEACTQAGLQVDHLGYQSEFLLQNGLLQQAEQMMASCESQQDMLKISMQIKQLTLPGEMGERFMFFQASRMKEETQA